MDNEQQDRRHPVDGLIDRAWPYVLVAAGLARAQRENHHFLETFFAAATLAVAATQQSTDHSILAAQIRFRRGSSGCVSTSTR
jgi:hypothetical protein